jgi:hypothetical protein
VHSRAVVNSKSSIIRLQLWDVGSLEPKMQTASLASKYKDMANVMS